MAEDTKNIRSKWSVADETAKVAASGLHELPHVTANRNAPAPRPNRKLISVRLHWPRVVLALAVIVGCPLGGLYWWRETHPQLPLGIVFGNGRLEADEIDIDTKFAARIAEIFVDEGAMVKAGQIVARMDTRDLEASLKKSQAQVNQAQRAVDEANHNVIQLTTQALLAQQELDRAKYLVERGAETKEVLDQRQQQLDGAYAALSAGKDHVTEAQHALEASTHDVELYTVNIADEALVAPRDGRIQYRIANIGEAAKCLPCSTSHMCIWISICPPNKPGRSSSVATPASCSMQAASSSK